ncbi:MAG: hypothetical protein KAT00_15310, partial [Planctomycetes bacterium]|nr:hypothetical protein [Planctomycetota bacterium]
MSLRLHREHGVNPSVEHCCLCGDSIGVVMFGAACKGEAPRKVSMGNVCDKCKGVLDSGGVFVFEAIGPDPDQRTGRMVAITSESAS